MLSPKIGVTEKNASNARKLALAPLRKGVTAPNNIIFCFYTKYILVVFPKINLIVS